MYSVFRETFWGHIAGLEIYDIYIPDSIKQEKTHSLCNSYGIVSLLCVEKENKFTLTVSPNGEIITIPVNYYRSAEREISRI